MSLPIVERRFPRDPGGLLPAITPDNVPEPKQSSTRTGTMVTRLATP